MEMATRQVRFTSTLFCSDHGLAIKVALTYFGKSGSFSHIATIDQTMLFETRSGCITFCKGSYVACSAIISEVPSVADANPSK